MVAGRTDRLTRKVGWGIAGPHAYIAIVSVRGLSGCPGCIITSIKRSIGAVISVERSRNDNLRKIESVSCQAIAVADL
jgi:hypothetical protein